LAATDEAILWDIRMPRVVLGALVGAMLAVAGATYQGVFRNPLADPYLLGVAAGGGPGGALPTAGLPGGPLGRGGRRGACPAARSPIPTCWAWRRVLASGPRSRSRTSRTACAASECFPLR